MTFAELKAALGDWLDKDTDSLPDAIRGQIINMAIQEYCRRFDLRFNEFTTAVTASAGIAFTTIPTGFSRPYSIWYLSDGVKADVDYLTKEEFDIKYPDSSETGDAIKHYTIWAGKIWWGPTPATQKSMNFNYYGFLTDLSVAADHNDFTDYAWSLLLFRGGCLASLFGIEDARMATWQSEYIKLENQLSLEHARAKSSGRRPASREYGYTGKR